MIINVLTDLPPMIGELGITTGMFLVWILKKLSLVGRLLSEKAGSPSCTNE